VTGMGDLLARLRTTLREHRTVVIYAVCWIAAAAILATVMS
jgi:hypothetical protein